jgi:rhamnulokinase
VRPRRAEHERELIRERRASLKRRLKHGDELLANPAHYRDRRTDGLLERAFGVVPRERIFTSTGLQFMQFNTLYQLYSMKIANSPALGAAHRLLMPDLFNYWLTGVMKSEATIASTTQFFQIPGKCRGHRSY